jgi:O-antigen/teichoic acid export membrane protein
VGINQVKFGAVLSYISMGLGFIVSILYTPVMLRLLGQSEYGLYNLVSSTVSYLSLLSFGLNGAYVRYYSRYKVLEKDDEIAKLNSMFISVFSVIGLIAILSGGVLVAYTDILFGEKLLPQEIVVAKKLMIVMVVNMALSFPASVFDSYIIANEKYIFQKLMQMVKLVVGPFVTLPILLLGYGSIGIVVASALLSILVMLSNTVFCLKKINMKFTFRDFDNGLLREIFVFSSFIFINMITDQVNWNIDKFLIGRFWGTVAVARYGIAAQLNSYYMSLSTAISNVFVPRVNRIVASCDDNNKLTLLVAKVGRVQFILLALICSWFILYGNVFIRIWAGPDYGEAYPIAVLLMVAMTIPLIQNLGIEIQRAKNMHQFRSWVYLFIAVANLLLSIPLTRIFGGVGSATGTTASLIVGNVIVMNWYYHYKVGLDMKYFWSEIAKLIPALAISIGIGVALNLVSNVYHIGLFITIGVIYTIIYSISIWYLGMNRFEKDLIAIPVRRIASWLKQKTK